MVLSDGRAVTAVRRSITERGRPISVIVRPTRPHATPRWLWGGSRISGGGDSRRRDGAQAAVSRASAEEHSRPLVFARGTYWPRSERWRLIRWPADRWRVLRKIEVCPACALGDHSRPRGRLLQTDTVLVGQTECRQADLGD